MQSTAVVINSNLSIQKGAEIRAPNRKATHLVECKAESVDSEHLTLALASGKTIARTVMMEAGMSVHCNGGGDIFANAYYESLKPHAHLASFHLLVDIASRMPLEPLPAMDEAATRDDDVTLPPLHDMLCATGALALVRKRSWSEHVAQEEEDARGSSSGSDSPPLGPRYSPLTAKMGAKSKRPIPLWPTHASELCRGVNDSWNSYQRANKGRSATTSEWKMARSQLWADQDAARW